MLKPVLFAAVIAATGLVQAQAQGTQTKKDLVAKVLQLQQGDVEIMARQLAEAPLVQLMQAANQALQQVPPERREALAKDIQADMRKYAEEAGPVVRDRAVKLAPSTMGAVLEEKFTEDELRQVIALLESPVTKKLQQVQPDLRKALVEKLVAETRGDVEPKLRTLEQSVRARLAPPAGAGESGAAPAPRPAAKPASSANRK